MTGILISCVDYIIFIISHFSATPMTGSDMKTFFPEE